MLAEVGMKHTPLRIPWKSLTVIQLKQLARAIDIAGRSKMNKQQLIRALKKEAASRRRVKSMIHKSIRELEKSKKARPSSPVRKRVPEKKTRQLEDIPETAPAAPAMPYIDRGKPIPDTYGRDVLRLMARDPEWVFVYWELTPERLNELHAQYADVSARTWQLKLTDMESDHVTYIPVFLGAHNWYVNVQPKRTYQVELGFTREGTFIPVTASNPCRTPSNAISERGDEEWIVMRRDLMQILKLTSEDELLFGDRPHTLGERYLEITEEQLELLRSQARRARALGASETVPPGSPQKKKR
jgi:hypothetical protein